MNSMQPTKPPKIPKGLISYSEGYLRQKIEKDYDYPTFDPSSCDGNTSQAIDAAILKYYPKYCRAIEIDQEPKSWPVISRLHQIKVIRHFLYDWSEESGEADYLRDLMDDVAKKTKNLLRNKRKCVKSLPVMGFQESGWSYNKCKVTLTPICSFFPNIKTLDVSLPSSSRENPDDSLVSIAAEKQLLRDYGYFWDYLKHVEHLELSTFSPNLWLILPYLQSSERFLPSLKTFHLTIFPYPQERKCPFVLFQVLLRNHDVLKYVTHLTFQGSKYLHNFHYYGHMIHSIIACCSILQYLKFPIQHDFTQDSPNQAFERNLAPLKSLQNIAILDLEIYNLWGFIEVFDFPVSLQKLTLLLTSYSTYEWNEVFESSENKKDSTLKEKKNFLSFVERFKKLTLLSSFRFIMLQSVKVKPLMDTLVFPILQAIPKLQEFECKLDPEDPFNLVEFFDGIVSLKHLKSFKISRASSRDKDSMINFQPSNSYSFPHVECVSLEGRASQDFDFKKFIQAFSNGSQMTLRDLSFEEIYVESQESFIKTLKILKDFGQYLSLKVNLKITLCLDKVDDLVDYFKSPIEVASNIITSLVINGPKKSKSACVSSDQLQALKNIFQNFKLDVALKLSDPSTNEKKDQSESDISQEDGSDNDEEDY